MFKRTRAFYLIWLIQIFSAINTGWWVYGEGGKGRDVQRRPQPSLGDDAGACEQLHQCQHVTGSPLWAPWSIYKRGHCGCTWFIDVPHPPRNRPAMRTDALSSNKAHSHATERTRTRPSHIFKWSDRFSFRSPDILRWVIRYDTVRLFLHFRVRFFPLGCYCSLVNFFS